MGLSPPGGRDDWKKEQRREKKESCQTSKECLCSGEGQLVDNWWTIGGEEGERGKMEQERSTRAEDCIIAMDTIHNTQYN